ncbi:SdrD B-like domain-containing protein [Candidatus Oscillochloris fontis]|uniref:SdrD B-like domain-containing protein n=1 Tax=Candidatus Oscillochloris fontis TaxID=2496868 RepID=UPI0013763E58|nr:SdrD B-like domain-containing protein [Candidatus Oscillochloris fontis]
MRVRYRHFMLLLILLGFVLIPLVPTTHAQVVAGVGFATAVPCVTAPPAVAVTTLPNTLVGTNPRAVVSDPALLLVANGGQTTLAPIGASAVAGENRRLQGGMGATYGLAYDDGSVSGVRRLFVAAYLKRSVGLGSAGLGAIYEYRFADGSWRHVLTVPGVGAENRPVADGVDLNMADQVATIGLGDLEIAPDGRTLYVMNLGARHINRYSLNADGTLTAQPPLGINWGLISNSAAVRNDLRPFGLGFMPPDPSAPLGTAPTLLVGVVDAATRVAGGNWDNPWPTPMGYVLAASNAGNGAWSVLISQNLRATPIQGRHWGSGFLANDPPQTGSWNPWVPRSVAEISVGMVAGVRYVRFAEPILSDIRVSRDGQMIFVAYRDRSGDQFFHRAPPAGQASVITQGDILTYQRSGTTWVLQGAAAYGDFFDDNTILDGGNAHIENFMGAVTLNLSGTAPNALTEQIVATSLTGSFQSGLRTYASTGGAFINQQVIHQHFTPAGGKASNLGDVETLCTYALIGGRLWQDTNADGVQNAGEPALPGITLELTRLPNATDAPLATLTTDAQGRYLFAVPPNTPLSIRIGASSRTSLAAAGWYLTKPNQGANDAADSDASDVFGVIEIAAPAYSAVGGGVTGIALPMPVHRSDLRTVDLGLTRVEPSGQIGDWVWTDTNINGIQDSGEVGRAAIPVTLLPDPTNAALLPGSYPQQTLTDAHGLYHFSQLPPGRYRVRFGPLPPNVQATLRDRGADDARDSDVDASTNLTSALISVGSLPPSNENRSIDLGLAGFADVWVQKNGPAEALLGGRLHYTLTYGNAGSLVAPDVRLVDDLPPGMTFVSADPAPSSVDGQRLTWDLGTLAPSFAGQIMLDVDAPVGMGAATNQPVINQASISTSEISDPPENNSSSSSGMLVRPELQITKSAPATVLLGEAFTYQIDYANLGSVDATDVLVQDVLPEGVRLTAWLQNPGAACTYDAASRTITCIVLSVPKGSGGTIQFSALADFDAAGSLVNTATIQTSTSGDDPADNSASSTTTVQSPNLVVELAISPAPFAVGTSGAVVVNYANRGDGVARNAQISLPVPNGVALGVLPAGWSFEAATRTLTALLGDLAPGASGTASIPLALPPTFGADALAMTATISSDTPEHPADLADNVAHAQVEVIRPNVFVNASGPGSIVGQGSVFWYTLEYGNQYRANPARTRAAQDVVLEAILPPDVTFVQADLPPSSVSGQTLRWDLGTLAANANGQIQIVVQTAVPAGATLAFSASISTTTPGDDPRDNRADLVTDVVLPPTTIGQSASDMRLAIHSDLDPQSEDGDAQNGVYVSDGDTIAWPSGEVLDMTPRLMDLTFPTQPLPFPYEYRARVVGWSLEGVRVNGTTHAPAAADSRGIAGCRTGAMPGSVLQLLGGCRYAYLGGQDLSNLARAVRESEMATQAHLYWTQPPAPPMRPDVYLYTLDPLRPVQVEIAVEVEVWIVNAYPGSIGGIPLPEIPVYPVPDPQRQRLDRTFTINLLVPRSVVGPGTP